MEGGKGEGNSKKKHPHTRANRSVYGYGYKFDNVVVVARSVAGSAFGRLSKANRAVAVWEYEHLTDSDSRTVIQSISQALWVDRWAIARSLRRRSLQCRLLLLLLAAVEQTRVLPNSFWRLHFLFFPFIVFPFLFSFLFLPFFSFLFFFSFFWGGGRSSPTHPSQSSALTPTEG